MGFFKHQFITPAQTFRPERATLEGWAGFSGFVFWCGNGRIAAKYSAFAVGWAAGIPPGGVRALIFDVSSSILRLAAGA